MATLTKTWTHDVNNVIANTLTQVQQYQELFFALHSAFVAAGYTVVASSDGTTASAGDNIASTADVVVGGGTSARTWALYEFPPSAQNKGQVLLEAEDTATTTPQDIRYTFSSLDFDISSISASAAPVEPSVLSYYQTDSVILRDWTTPVDGVWHSIVSDRGDVIFFAKRQSSTFNDFECWIRCDDPAEAGTGAEADLCAFKIHNPFSFSNSGLGAGVTNTSDVGAYTNLSNEIASQIAVGGPSGFGPTGGPNSAAWAGGLDAAGRLLVFDLELYTSTEPFRWMGKWVDIKAVSSNAPGGTVENGDADPIRYAVVAFGVMIPWPAAEFPIL